MVLFIGCIAEQTKSKGVKNLPKRGFFPPKRVIFQSREGSENKILSLIASILGAHLPQESLI